MRKGGKESVATNGRGDRGWRLVKNLSFLHVFDPYVMLRVRGPLPPVRGLLFARILVLSNALRAAVLIDLFLGGSAACGHRWRRQLLGALLLSPAVVCFSPLWRHFRAILANILGAMVCAMRRSGLCGRRRSQWCAGGRLRPLTVPPALI